MLLLLSCSRDAIANVPSRRESCTETGVALWNRELLKDRKLANIICVQGSALGAHSIIKDDLLFSSNCSDTLTLCSPPLEATTTVVANGSRGIIYTERESVEKGVN